NMPKKNHSNRKEGGGMRKRTWLKAAMVMLLGAMPVMTSAESVTEMVNKQMNSYNTREMLPSDFSFVVGLPHVLGVEYDRMATGMLSLGLGAGSFVTGTSLNTQVRFYPLTTAFSPYAGAGLTYYYVNSDSNVLAWHADAGVDYTFNGGWGLSLGVTYARFLTTSVNPFMSSSTNVSNLI